MPALTLGRLRSLANLGRIKLLSRESGVVRKSFVLGSLFQAYTLTCLVRAMAIPAWIVSVEAHQSDPNSKVSGLSEYTAFEGVSMGIALMCLLAAIVCGLMRMSLGSRVVASQEKRLALRQRMFDLMRAVCIEAGFQVFFTMLAVMVFAETQPTFNESVMYSQGFLSCVAAFVSGVFSFVFFLIDFYQVTRRLRRTAGGSGGATASTNDEAAVSMIEAGKAEADEVAADREGNLNPLDIRLARATLMTVSTLIVGAFMFGRLEGWRFDTAYNWAISTLLTIGYGNVAPKRTFSRILLFVYGFVGIAVVGYFLIALRDAFINRLLLDADKLARPVRLQPKKSFSEDASHEYTAPLKTASADTADPAAATGGEEHAAPGNELARSQSQQEVRYYFDGESRPLFVQAAKITAFYVIYWLSGATVFKILQESWSFMDSLYFCFVSLTTIGYGDMYPTRPLSWEFWSFYVFISVSAGAYFMGIISEMVSDKISQVVISRSFHEL